MWVFLLPDLCGKGFSSCLVSRDKFWCSSGVPCSVLQKPPAFYMCVCVPGTCSDYSTALCPGILVSLLMCPHASLCTSVSSGPSLPSADAMDIISLNNSLPLAVGDFLILHWRPLCSDPIEVVSEMWSSTIALFSCEACCLGKGTSICTEKWQEMMFPVTEDAFK